MAARLRRRRRTFALLGLALLLYALAGYVLLPALLRSAATRYAAGELHAQLSIGALRFDPFRCLLQVDDLRLRDARQQPLLGFKRLRVNADPLLSLFTASLRLAELRLEQPDLDLVLYADGSLNLLRLLPPSPPQPETSPSALPDLRIATLAISAGHLRFTDHSKPAPFTLELQPVDFTLQDLRTQLGHASAYQLSALSRAGERLDWRGELSLQPLALSGALRIGALQARTVAAYLQNQLPLRLLDGEVDVQGHYQLQLSPQLELALQLPQIELRQLALGEYGGTQTPLRVRKISLRDLDFSLAQRRLQLRTLTLEAPQLQLRREADGRLNLSRLLAPAAPVAADSAKSAAASPAADSKAVAWQLALDELQLREGLIDVQDLSLRTPFAMQLPALSLQLAQYRNSADSQPRLRLDTRLRQNGRDIGQLHLSGSLRPAAPAASLQLQLQGLQLSALQPYLQQYSGVLLHSGVLGLQAQLDYATQSRGANLHLAGALDIAQLRAADRAQDQDFARWRQLQLEGFDLQLPAQEAPRLRIARVRLREPYARVIVQADQSLNLAQLGSAPSAAPQPPAAAAAVAPADAKPLQLEIGALRIENGSAYFADESITPRFAAGIEQLQGGLDRLSSAADARTHLQLRGQVAAYAPVSIDGSLMPLAPTRYSDLSLAFRNMELSTFNPYSGKFAGYNIAKGKLSTELHYHIEDRVLRAEHHVRLDQLEFGEATGSKDAAPLPVKLAVALLKDRHGVIDLQLPVNGSLDDPQFRYGALLRQTFFNLLTRIASAPFAALGALFGGGEELQYLDFAPGSAALGEATRDKLAALRKALLERPALKLEVPQTVSETDREALAQQALAAQLPAASDTAGQRRALEALMQQLQLPRPEAGASEAALRGALLTALQPGAQALEELGRQRALAVQDALLSASEIAPERLFIVGAGPAGASDSGAVRMPLSLR
ncbi:Uncharacterized protein involved in outer membrane biogenesis [Solimonas aquatica]|uniref:Uncharacterized protein involved in outer membrane biogenesis n=2 Tax=Solimonas aquatica TaxID=489703 RepID=A0A1H9DZ06_9GAMM|nr:Uncharacterized protein involved in outer membrane biogenesis [Solimonas aquatica]